MTLPAMPSVVLFALGLPAGRILCVLAGGIRAGRGRAAGSRVSAVLEDAVERDHHTERWHDVFVLGDIERIAVAKGKPLPGDGGDFLLALLESPRTSQSPSGVSSV